MVPSPLGFERVQLQVLSDRSSDVVGGPTQEVQCAPCPGVNNLHEVRASVTGTVREVARTLRLDLTFPLVGGIPAGFSATRGVCCVRHSYRR